MDKKVAEDLKGKADLTLFFVLFVDVGVAAGILTSPHLSIGWLVFWWVAQVVTLLMSATVLAVWASRPVQGEIQILEGLMAVASWILRVCWFAWAALLLLMAVATQWIAVLFTGALTALYFMVLTLCYSASPGSKE